MTYTEKDRKLIESVKKALYEEGRKYSTAQERNLISIFQQAVAEERARVEVEIEKMEKIANNPSFDFKIIKELKGCQVSCGIEDRALVEIVGIVKDRVLYDLIASLEDSNSKK